MGHTDEAERRLQTALATAQPQVQPHANLHRLRWALGQILVQLGQQAEGEALIAAARPHVERERLLQDMVAGAPQAQR